TQQLGDPGHADEGTQYLQQGRMNWTAAEQSKARVLRQSGKWCLTHDYFGHQSITKLLMDGRRTADSQPDREQHNTGGNRPQFEFITVSGTNIRGDSETRRRVRSRAQADYRRRNPPPPRNAITIDLDVGSWLQTLSRDAALRPAQYAPLPVTSQSTLQAGETFQMSTAEHVYGGGCVIFKSMIEIGYLDILRGSASLTQMLSSSAWHRKRMNIGDHESSIDYARYSLMATRSLRRQLDDPAQRTSLETILAILTFAAFARAHPPIRIDIRGAYLQDTKPRFPQPYDTLLAESKLRITQMPSPKAPSSNCTLAEDPAVVHIFDSIQQVTSIVNSEAETQGHAFWLTVLFPGFHFAPILHDLLSLPRDPTGIASRFSKRRECFRLASILYISEIRAKFGMDNTGATSFAYKLLRLLKSREMLVSWGSDNFYLLWALMIGSVSLCVPETLRLEFMELLSEYPSVTGTASLRDSLPIVSGVLI
ncbi:uncharacterized protein TRIREDRAFT_110323, partial [Trichoderma reesei QM6a]